MAWEREDCFVEAEVLNLFQFEARSDVKYVVGCKSCVHLPVLRTECHILVTNKASRVAAKSAASAEGFRKSEEIPDRRGARSNKDRSILASISFPN